MNRYEWLAAVCAALATVAFVVARFRQRSKRRGRAKPNRMSAEERVLWDRLISTRTDPWPTEQAHTAGGDGPVG